MKRMLLIAAVAAFVFTSVGCVGPNTLSRKLSYFAHSGDSRLEQQGKWLVTIPFQPVTHVLDFVILNPLDWWGLTSGAEGKK
jgi:hypothetical protein